VSFVAKNNIGQRSGKLPKLVYTNNQQILVAVTVCAVGGVVGVVGGAYYMNR
jgi:hypothetical protein